MVSDDRLMSMFSEMVSWSNFAATILAQAEIEETKAEAEVKYQEAVQFVKAPINTKVTDVRAQMHMVPEVGEARVRAMEAYATRKMESVMYNNCERVVALISRELSRRIGVGPTERRNSRWNP